MVRVLDEDPDLASALGPASLAEARQRAIAPVLEIDRGAWDPPVAALDATKDLGLLVLSGLLRRDLRLAGRTFSELRGPEDLLRPWDDASEVATVRGTVSWRAIQPTRLAWLDGDFAECISQWPAIHASLVSRALRRARLLSFRLAVLELRQIDLRVVFLLWHLADRWGWVAGDGVHLDLPLTHDQIGRMVGAHRTSVTVAVQKLTREGRLRRGEQGTWVLLGEPPKDLNDFGTAAKGRPGRASI